LKRALVVGLGYHPGHFLHMEAFIEMFQKLDYSVYWYFSTRYDKTSSNTSRLNLFSLRKIDASIIYTPSLFNFLVIPYLRIIRRSHVYFYFHEPFDTIRSYKNSGFSISRIFMLLCIGFTNKLCCLASSSILLGSDRSLEVYSRKYLVYNRNFRKLPLIYPDVEVSKSIVHKKKYISYIGTVASDHAFDSFLSFLISAVKDSDLRNFSFLIATSSTLPISMINTLKKYDIYNQVKLVHGTYMDDDFINNCYAESMIVWNAYIRGMQSGVLARSFMFAAPVLVYSKNINEYVKDKVNSYFISDLNDFEQFKNAIMFCFENLAFLTTKARDTFDWTFNYNNYLSIFNNERNNSN
jgi:hypothetical protein